MKVVIVGAGIGGLTLALALQREGIEAEVFEASETIRPLGVGINLLPHAVAELMALGLGDALGEIGIETAALAYYNRFGQRIWHEPRGRAAGYPVPQYSIHRGAFQMLLHETAAAPGRWPHPHRPGARIGRAHRLGPDGRTRPAGGLHAAKPRRRHPLGRAARLLSERRPAALLALPAVARRD